MNGPVVKYKDNKWIAICTFYEKDTFKNAGFRWNKTDKIWYTTDINCVEQVKDYCSPEDIEKLNEQKVIKQKAIEGSHISGTDFQVPAPDGLVYMPFQLAGIKYASTRNNILFADEMGLGKTIQAIGLINLKPEIKKVLIICPASLKLNWQQELKKWLTRNYTISIIKGTKDQMNFDTDIVIINYDILAKHVEKLSSMNWDYLIADESHYLKNYKTQRTKAYVEIYPQAKIKAHLTGTPIPNRPIEFFTQLTALGVFQKSDWYRYITRFCEGHQSEYGWDVKGASNLEELQEILRSTVMIRRLKRNVLTELPEKVRQIIPINCENKTFWDENKELLNKYKSYYDVLSNLSSDDASFEELSKLRHQLALAKLDSCIEYIDDTLEDKDKVVVFAHHRDVIDKLMEHYGDKAVKVVGGMSDVDKNESVQQFQNNPDVKIFVGNIRAAGVGLTLTASDTVIFVEIDWVPGNVEQAEDRCHRIGQKGMVLSVHLVLEGTLEVHIANTMYTKKRILGTIFDSNYQKMSKEDL